MHKKDNDEIISIIEGIVSSLEKTASNQNKFIDISYKLFYLIELLVKNIKIIFFVLGILLYRVFLWSLTNRFIDNINSYWSSTSESYRILILSLIGTIIAGIISQVMGSLILEKVKVIFKKDKL